MGDVRAISVKRVAAAVGEGSTAVRFARQSLRQAGWRTNGSVTLVGVSSAAEVAFLVTCGRIAAGFADAVVQVIC